jgi:hypothetical protein
VSGQHNVLFLMLMSFGGVPGNHHFLTSYSGLILISQVEVTGLVPFQVASVKNQEGSGFYFKGDGKTLRGSRPGSDVMRFMCSKFTVVSVQILRR